jgi:hypothetical protein
LAVAGLTVIIFGRKYFFEENEIAYAAQIKYANLYAKEYGPKHVNIWFDGADDILEYYIQKYNLQTCSYNRIQNYGSTRSIRLMNPSPLLALGLQAGSDPMIKARLEQYYGRPASELFFNAGEFLLFDSRNKTEKSWVYEKLNPSQNNDIQFKNLDVKNTDFVIIVLESYGVERDIETSIFCGDKQIDWRSTKVAPYEAYSAPSLHVIKLADIPKWSKKCSLHIQLKNYPAKGEIQTIPEIIQFGYRIMRGNPYVYGINP